MTITYQKLARDQDNEQRLIYAATVADGDEIIILGPPLPLTVKAFPASGGTATVKTSTSPMADVMAGTANWSTEHASTADFADILLSAASAVSIATASAACDVEIAHHADC